MRDYQYTFTVFSPCYNCEKTVHRVYESLCAQTYRDFEWVALNDGSTDRTLDVLRKYQQEAGFPMQVIDVQPNRGKPHGLNRGVSAARGEFFLPLDGDDGCVKESLEVLLRSWQGIPKDRRSVFRGVVCHCKDEKGQRVGDSFPRSPWDVKNLDVTFRRRIEGEKWGFVRTDIMKAFPFPEVDHYVPESTVWLPC